MKKGDEVTLIGRDGDEFIGVEEIWVISAADFPMSLPVISARVCRESILKTGKKYGNVDCLLNRDEL